MRQAYELEFVAVLAPALQRKGANVGIVDAEILGLSIPGMDNSSHKSTATYGQEKHR
ncbi:hypothetical protein SAMN04487869_101411 [Marinobacter sp. DSM 26671]|jgi:Mrp family chromosome partitioning ATPase|uniref:Mrp/NBP35 family ATP-binding protein n=1 Tax=Marinobacter sp. DSM 26671 TaxID=1761793 RepID=UPI0008F013AB|nr:Mrp/NBP35 family ATP-binding protein [Marinobacter sp. DSM 26671]SFD96515.1 hypothetical protein SAMN04487869_101411 [Marinobacter sp. DSM 26671]